MFVREFLAVSWLGFGKPLSLFGLFSRDGMRPRIAEAKPHCSFLGGDFRRDFDYGAEWIVNLAGVLTVSEKDAPELVAGFQSRRRAHARS
jgi:hypothetical protein